MEASVKETREPAQATANIAMENVNGEGMSAKPMDDVVDRDAAEVLDILLTEVVNGGGDGAHEDGVPVVLGADIEKFPPKPVGGPVSCEAQVFSNVRLVPYRDPDDGDSDSSSSSSSSSSSEDKAPARIGRAPSPAVDDEDFELEDPAAEDEVARPAPKRKGAPGRAVENRRFKSPGMKTPGELDIEDLPPIEDLRITIPQTELRRAGIVFSAVEQLLVIESTPGQPVLDLDSVLFLAGGNPLGQVFDVFGPVSSPFYVVRFNSAQELAEKNIEKGTPVFYAPLHADVTIYVLESEVRKLRGSDASWENNNEPPPEHLDFSDDEHEREILKRRRGKHSAPTGAAATTNGNGSEATAGRTPSASRNAWSRPGLPTNGNAHQPKPRYCAPPNGAGLSHGPSNHSPRPPMPYNPPMGGFAMPSLGGDPPRFSGGSGVAMWPPYRPPPPPPPNWQWGPPTWHGGSPHQQQHQHMQQQQQQQQQQLLCNIWSTPPPPPPGAARPWQESWPRPAAMNPMPPPNQGCQPGSPAGTSPFAKPPPQMYDPVPDLHRILTTPPPPPLL